MARLLTELPDPLPVGAGTACFVDGLLGEWPAGARTVEIVAGERRFPALGWGVAPPGSRRGADYWWGIVEIGAIAEPAELPLSLRIGTDRGRELWADLGTLRCVPGLAPPEEAVAARTGAAGPAAEPGGEGEGPLVAICMATYEPDPELLRRQLDSLRAQQHRRWICLISDDGSSARGREAIRAAVGDDRRFLVSHATRNRGFYANFERALTMVPEEAELVALCDQDDRWHPDKLTALIAALDDPAVTLAYGDMRIVTRDGAELAPTYWTERRNNHTDFGSLLLANTVTGAAALFRRALLTDVLPFPPRHSNAFHDHWIAQVAMALGRIAYVPRPLHDYVQHGAAALGHHRANGSGRFGGGAVARGRASVGRLRARGWRLGWRQPYFNVYCRILLFATVLRTRCGARMEPGKRARLERLLDPRRGLAWLLRRAARPATTETLGRERVIVAGIAWRRLAGLRARLQRRWDRDPSVPESAP